MNPRCTVRGGSRASLPPRALTPSCALADDSVTGKPLFVAPIGRTMADFLSESKKHGWPSFRDSEVVWENMRVLKATGEAVSADGTHLVRDLAP